MNKKFYSIFPQANQLSNVLIWESEDLGPIGTRFQHQTVDQDHHNGNTMLLSTTYLLMYHFKLLQIGSKIRHRQMIYQYIPKKANKNIENLPT